MGKNNWIEATQGGSVPGLDSERIAFCADFLEDFHRSDIENIMLAEDGSAHFSIVIE